VGFLLTIYYNFDKIFLGGEIMSNLQYDNFPKFIVSLGIVMIAIPFIIILFFLQENSVLLIAEDEILKLTEIAKNTISTKQQFSQWISNYLVHIFVFFECLGLGTFLLGCKMWYTLQQKLDKKQDIDYETAKKQLEKLSADEHEQKISSEINELSSPSFDNTDDDSVELISLDDIITRQEDVRQQNRVINAAIRQRYKIVEAEIINKIKDKLNSNYETQDNVRIGYFSFDAVSMDKKGEIDYIFEIKYIMDPKTYSRSRWAAVLSHIKEQLSVYQEQIKRNVKAVIIVVTPANKTEDAEKVFKQYGTPDQIELYCLPEESSWFPQSH